MGKIVSHRDGKIHYSDMNRTYAKCIKTITQFNDFCVHKTRRQNEQSVNILILVSTSCELDVIRSSNSMRKGRIIVSSSVNARARSCDSDLFFTAAAAAAGVKLIVGELG